MRAPGLGGAPGLVLTPFGLRLPIRAVGTQYCLPSAYEPLGSLMEPKGSGRAWNMGESCGCPWDGRSCCHLPLSLLPPVPCRRGLRSTRRCCTTSRQLALCPTATPAPGAPPSKPCAHPSGLSPQGGAIQSSQNGCCWRHPRPQAGALGVGRDCGPGDCPPLGLCHTGFPSGAMGTQGRKRRRCAVRAHPTAEAAGAGCTMSSGQSVLCCCCCGTWARHPHSLGVSAARGQAYFRDH